MVSPGKRIFKDFSSGKGGNVVTFLMEHEHLSYPEALKWLANKYNIEIIEKEETHEQIKEKHQREALYLAHQFANDFFKFSTGVIGCTEALVTLPKPLIKSSFSLTR